MVTYYAKRALEILWEEGPVELFKRVINFLTIRLSKEYLARYPCRPLFELQKIRLKLTYGGSAPSPYNLIYINPQNITYYRYMRYIVTDEHFLNISKSTARYGTFVIEGSWDKEPGKDKYDDHHYKMKFEDYILWEATVDYYEKGIDWENTIAYQESNKSLSSLRKVEELYNIIQCEGYKSQRQLREGLYRYFMPPEYDEIRVNIGRDGEIFFDDGRHRFCAVRMLGLEKIPVRVYVRHKEWQEFRTTVYKNGLPEDREHLRDHPDLQDVLN